MDFSVDKQSDVLATSPAGEHYKAFAIEPIQYIEANKLSFHEGAVVKYVTRWRLKDGVEDLKKARFYLDRMIQLEERKKPPVSEWQGQSGQNDLEDAVVGTVAIHYDSTKERYVSTEPWPKRDPMA